MNTMFCGFLLGTLGILLMIPIHFIFDLTHRQTIIMSCVLAAIGIVLMIIGMVLDYRFWYKFWNRVDVLFSKLNKMDRECDLMLEALGDNK